MLLVIRTGIFQLEALRQVIIHLNRTQLPTTTDRILHHEVQLRTIESSLTILDLRRQALLLTCLHDRLLSLLPVLVATDILLTIRLVAQRDLCLKVLKVHRLKHVHHVQELLLHLIRTAEKVRVILRKAAHTSQSVQLTALLVTANRTELSQTQRQILIRTGRVLENHTVVRAVHRFQEVLLALLRRMDRLERILAILRIVTRSDIQHLVSNRRTHHLLITVLSLDATQEILQAQAQSRTLRQPHRQTLAHHVREHKEIHLLTNLTVVTFLRLLQHHQILIQHLLLWEGDTIKTYQLLALLIATPISSCHAQDLHCLQVRGVRQVRATAQIGERTLRIGCDRTISQLADQLSLIFFTAVAKHLQSVRLRDALTLDLLLLGYQLLHLRLDSGKVALLDHGLTRIYIIVKTILDSRTDTELNARIQLLQRLSHQVRARMPESMLAFLIVPLQQLYRRIFLDRTGQIPCLAIHACGQYLLRQTRTDALRYLHSGRTLRILSHGIVRKCNLNHDLYIIYVCFFSLLKSVCKISIFLYSPPTLFLPNVKKKRFRRKNML